MSKSIQVDDLSKAYQLGNFSTGTISRDIERFVAKLRGKDDPFLKIGETNDRSKVGTSDIVWSLKDINFEIEQGDAVGIIGKNGAGKSTLLKILSRVTSPTTGKIKIKGRIASLLEVGTGFHPELTGRENIYLNGAILGMRKLEIKMKLDEIVDFSGIERYLDTPVKRYSSGMYVRLAFAVAAHLECEILVVDEVLAVGDAEFQKKCLGKMGNISQGEGRTILFVSHNMGMISQLCKNGIYLNNGLLHSAGEIKSTINKYLSNHVKTKNNSLTMNFNIEESNDKVHLDKFSIKPHFDNSNDFLTNKEIEIKFFLDIKFEIIGLRIGFEIANNNLDDCVFRTFHDDLYEELISLKKGKIEVRGVIPKNLLNEGEYLIYPTVGIHNVEWLSFKNHILQLNLINIDGVNSIYSDKRPGIVAPKINWDIHII